MHNLCFVIPSLQQGGAERVLAEVANELSKRNRVSVISFDAEDSYYPLDPGVAFFKIGNIKRSVPGRAILNIAKRLLSLTQLIRKVDPDAVISFLDIASVNVLLSDVAFNKPIILSEHCNPLNSLLSRSQKVLRKTLYRRAAGIVSPTRESFEIFQELGIELPLIQRVITNPLPASLNPAGDVLSCKRENIVLFVGRLAPEKQVDHLIDIFHAAKLPGWQLHIVGDGPERNRLEKHARQYAAVSHVVFLGQQKELLRYYQSAKILALTSKTEGLSNVLLEAMSNGGVCVSYDCRVGPSTLIQHGVNGLLVPAQDKEKFVSEMVALATDGECYVKLQREAVKLRDHVTVERIGMQWEEMVQTVLSSDSMRSSEQ